MPGYVGASRGSGAVEIKSLVSTVTGGGWRKIRYRNSTVAAVAGGH